MLALSDLADALEIIKTQSHFPSSSVPTQQSFKTLKQRGNPGRSGPHSTLFQVLIIGIYWNLLCAYREKQSDRERVTAVQAPIAFPSQS